MHNKNYKAYIVDDDSDFLDALSFFIKKMPNWDVYCFNSIIDCKNSLSKLEPDLALLDIEFGEKENGIDLGIYIKEKYPNVRIIYFTSSYKDEYYETAKRSLPNAFLDKQLSALKVKQAIELAFLQNTQPVDNQAPRSEVLQLGTEFMFVKIGTSFKKISLKDIDYIIYEDRYSNLVIDKKLIPLNLPIRDLAKNLPPKNFMQIHQSYIVNLDKVVQISIANSNVELHDKVLPIGTSFKKSIQEKLNLFV